jgi:DNA polymerase-3 subunit delta'
MWQIIGQSKAVSLLKRSLEKGKLAHAYLFVGPPSVGKMTLALTLAQALNCANSQPPCGECNTCQKIATGKHADVQIIGLAGGGNSSEARPKTEIGIDQIRDIQHSASLPPFEGNCRVYIIDGAEQMSIEASNCLLKTLEEPMDRVVFILLTTNEKLLLETIISRCQRLELPPMAVDDIEQALINRWQVEPQRSHFLSRACHGCPGWAISALHDDGILQQREEQLRRFIVVVNADYEERFACASEVALQFTRDRSKVFELLKLWRDFWHDVMMVKTDVTVAVANVDFLDALTGMAQAFSLSQIRTSIRDIDAAVEHLKLNANSQLVLEVLMLSIPRKEEKIKKAPSAALR